MSAFGGKADIDQPPLTISIYEYTACNGIDETGGYISRYSIAIPHVPGDQHS
jgi:hypothetical protein